MSYLPIENHGRVVHQPVLAGEQGSDNVGLVGPGRLAQALVGAVALLFDVARIDPGFGRAVQQAHFREQEQVGPVQRAQRQLGLDLLKDLLLGGLPGAVHE